MANAEPGIPQDEHLADGPQEVIAAAPITVATTGPLIDGTGDQKRAAPIEHRDAPVAGSRSSHAKQVGEPKKRSLVTTVIVTAAVASVCGVIGAMGYLYFFGPKPGDSSSSQAKTEAGSHQESSPGAKAGGGSSRVSAQDSSTPASAASSIPGFNSAEEVSGLKDQIKDLNHRINRLDEELDRVEQLLSLAVPLLQRIAPKH